MTVFDDKAPVGEFLEPLRSISALADSINAGADSPTVTPVAIRNHVNRADENGLAPFVVRMGRKIYISEPGYRWWRRSHALKPSDVAEKEAIQ